MKCKRKCMIYMDELNLFPWLQYEHGNYHVTGCCSITTKACKNQVPGCRAIMPRVFFLLLLTSIVSQISLNQNKECISMPSNHHLDFSTTQVDWGHNWSLTFFLVSQFGSTSLPWPLAKSACFGMQLSSILLIWPNHKKHVAEFCLYMLKVGQFKSFNVNHLIMPFYLYNFC
jgi:hypothetical protein